jgi:hypothetical protein
MVIYLGPERRREARSRTLQDARIVFNDRRSTVDCTVRNLSHHGALLVMPSTAGIPAQFELWIGDACHHARIVWIGKDRMGVEWDWD